MYLMKAHGKEIMTAGCALLMFFSMVINESMVARTFGSYTLQLFDASQDDWLVAALVMLPIIIREELEALRGETCDGNSLFHKSPFPQGAI